MEEFEPVPLDPMLETYIFGKRNDPRFSDMTPREARQSRADSRMQRWDEAVPVAAEDVEIPMPWGPCAARLYRPEGATGTQALALFFHGGGFVVCSIETHDGLARSISGGAGMAVLSVDYRLAPEHVFPAARDDAIASLHWVLAHAEDLSIDPASLFLIGDSAGAHVALSAVLALGTTAMPVTLAGIALFYPVLDAPAIGQGSYIEFANGYGLTASDMTWFWDHYTARAADPEAARLLVLENLSALPPCYILTAEYDVLRDEGEALAARLFQAGVPVSGRRVKGVNHNFLAFARDLPAAGAAIREVCEWLRHLAAK